MIKGEVKLVFRDINTGEITKTYKQKNAITESQIALYAGMDADDVNDNTLGRYVFIGTWEQPTNRNWSRMYDVAKVGYVESGINSPLWIDPGSPDDPYIQYQNRFDPPTGTSSRTIYTVGVGYDDDESTQANINRWMTAGAYVGLQTPCVQTDTETLDVFYRIIFDVDEAAGMSRSQVIYFGGRLAHDQTVNRPWTAPPPQFGQFYMTGKVDPVALNNSWFRNGYRSYGSKWTTLGGSILTNSRFRARIVQSTLALTQILGRIVGTFGYSAASGSGLSDTEIFHSKLLKAGDSPVQNIFGHTTSATGPFFSSSTAQTGTGTINVNGDAWTNPDYHYLYRLDVVTSGDVGVGEYKLRRRKVVGFLNNTYEDDHVAVPFMNGSNNAGMGDLFDGQEGFTNQYGPHGIRYGDATNMVIFDKTYVGKLDVMTGERQRWDSGTTPAAGFTNTRQVKPAANGDVWVADDTGLYRLDVGGVVVDQFNPTLTAQLSTLGSDVCYGVTETQSGRIWAAFQNGFALTTDSGANWTVYTSAVFNADNTKIYGINGDPQNADDRIAVIYAAATAGNVDLDIHWWDRVTDAVSANRIDRFWFEGNFSNNPSLPRDTFQMFTCSPNDSIWGTAYDDGVDGAALYAWDSTTPSQSQVRPRNHVPAQYRSFSWEEATDGQDALVYFASSSSDPRVCMLEQDGTNNLSSNLDNGTEPSSGAGWNFWDNSAQYGMRAWLPGGIVIFSSKGNNFSASIEAYYISMYGVGNDALGGAFERVLWEEYGWNGAAWELDNPNGKLIHNTQEALLDGLTVAFNEGGPGTFVANEYYTVGIVDGVMADGATTFDHRQVYYMKPAVFNVSDFETANLPAAPQSVGNKISTGTRVNDSGAYSAGLTWTDTGGNVFTETQVQTDNSSSNGGGRTDNEIPASEDGEVYFTFYSASSGNGSTAGLSDIAKRGTGRNADTIDYGFRINNGPGSQAWQVEIVENGSVALIVDAGNDEYFSDDHANQAKMDRSNEQQQSFRIKRVGTTIEYYWREQLVYTSLVPSSTALCFDTWLERYIGIAYVTMTYPFTDYIGEIGNSTLQTGKFDTDFFQIVNMGESKMSVVIGGVEGTDIGNNDYTTVLSAGEYSILTGGYLRYAAADAGSSIAVNYTYLKNI